MNKPLDELYLEWLYHQVGEPNHNRRRTYWRILKQLYTKEFVWIVPNDDNRIADGRDLRFEFVDSTRLNDVDPGWINLGCSILELLVALSRRFAFEAEGKPRDWFWHMMENLGLDDRDDKSYWSSADVDAILEDVIWRNYGPDGVGGIFPLRHPHEDQRKVELWYQLSAYILEREEG